MRLGIVLSICRLLGLTAGAACVDFWKVEEYKLAAE